MGVPVQSIAPLEPIDLPRGRKDVPVREFNWQIQRLHDEAIAHPNDEAKERVLLHAICPDITDAEIDDLSGGEKAWIVMYAGHRLDEMVAALKNVGGAAAAPSTPLSAPTTSTSTPSPVSGKSRAGTGSRSRSGRSGARSGLSIG